MKCVYDGKGQAEASLSLPVMPSPLRSQRKSGSGIAQTLGDLEL